MYTNTCDINYNSSLFAKSDYCLLVGGVSRKASAIVVIFVNQKKFRQFKQRLDTRYNHKIETGIPFTLRSSNSILEVFQKLIERSRTRIERIVHKSVTYKDPKCNERGRK